MGDYLIKLFLTIIIVVIGFGILYFLYNIFGVWGVICGFVTLIVGGILAYNYTNKKEKESCPLNKEKK